MAVVGKVGIVLRHRGGRSYKAEIVSERPKADRVLQNKTPEQALAAAPLLFAICGNAQAYAALLACRTALGMAAEPKHDAAREMLAQMEILREHAWRIFLDWPGFAGLDADKKPLAALLTFDSRFKRLLFRDGHGFGLDSVLNLEAVQLAKLIDELELLIDGAIFNGDLTGFRMISDESDLRIWLQENNSLPACLLNGIYHRQWASIGQNNIGCLPEMDGNALSKYLQQQDLNDFSRQPHWQGRCFETTALNRQCSQPLIIDAQNRYQNGLLVRILARLQEVSRIPMDLRRLLIGINDDAMLIAADGELEDGVGLGLVQAARGLLIHRVALRQGRVQDYCIIAPTEWNFHPEGVVAQGLRSLRANDPGSLRLQANMLINSVDPCVQYDLFLSDEAPESHA
ncbi:MAG: nickel-dependent hydrogenase large subunit [Methylomonas sp.]